MIAAAEPLMIKETGAVRWALNVYGLSVTSKRLF
jgi:hypothetical protein